MVIDQRIADVGKGRPDKCATASSRVSAPDRTSVNN